MKRRNFIQHGIAISALVGIEIPSMDLCKGDKFSLPLVVSTWDNRRANDAAFQVLHSGANVLDAIVAGVKVPEADPADRSVGYGGRPDRSGRVTLDACIMDSNGKAGSVTYVQHYKHPIEIARMVMEKTPHVILSGDGAELFAAKMGMKQMDLLTEESKKEYEAWRITEKYQPIINIERHDTIGLLAIDKAGNLAGGCSTSGMAYKMEGRVGDSPIIGAGLFVDNEVGACTATGHGEYVLRTLASFLVVEFMRNGMHPQKACEKAIKRIVNKHKGTSEEYQIGLIALDKKGRIGYYSVRKGFLCAIKNTENELVKDSEYAI
ncbi:MAG: N(4)-(beta-N-acetylglucosaminyl)-L-asparaginase [Saprospiraceae bacterium]|nr:N(4)-(beta-N-acetylglucosaminyl)-L-asparaginase [Saprospiraceae bacterium]